jgi:peptide/nickel transport system substrate-binding protein
MVEAVGGSMQIQTTEQSQLISDAIGNNFQAIGWRLHPGGDPDLQYVWWHGGSPVNFGKFSDPEIDRLLDEGRAESDPAKREVIYQDLNKRFATQAYDLWDQWTLWTVATATDVHGVFGADLPDGSKPFPGLADGHSLTGLWIGG